MKFKYRKNIELDSGLGRLGFDLDGRAKQTSTFFALLSLCVWWRQSTYFCLCLYTGRIFTSMVPN